MPWFARVFMKIYTRYFLKHVCRCALFFACFAALLALTGWPRRPASLSRVDTRRIAGMQRGLAAKPPRLHPSHGASWRTGGGGDRAARLRPPILPAAPPARKRRRPPWLPASRTPRSLGASFKPAGSAALSFLPAVEKLKLVGISAIEILLLLCAAEIMPIYIDAARNSYQSCNL